MRRPVIYCAHIGSVAAGHFGWARGCGGEAESAITGCGDIETLPRSIAADLNRGLPVALGFECPLWVPLSDDPAGLTRARPIDGKRPYCAGAGAAVLATGLTEVVWTLREVKLRSSVPASAFLGPAEFREAGSGLFLWEAFVSGGAKPRSDARKGSREDHVEDAKAAVRAFVELWPEIPAAEVARGTEVYSLIGAALLRSGWSEEVALLRTPCSVVKVMPPDDA
jgi:hypothetical protein